VRSRIGRGEVRVDAKPPRAVDGGRFWSASSRPEHLGVSGNGLGNGHGPHRHQASDMSLSRWLGRRAGLPRASSAACCAQPIASGGALASTGPSATAVRLSRRVAHAETRVCMQVACPACQAGSLSRTHRRAALPCSQDDFHVFCAPASRVPLAGVRRSRLLVPCPADSLRFLSWHAIDRGQLQTGSCLHRSHRDRWSTGETPDP